MTHVKTDLKVRKVTYVFRAPLSLLELEAVEVGVGSGSRPARSNPVNMPISSGSRPIVPVLIESGSGSMEKSFLNPGKDLFYVVTVYFILTRLKLSKTYDT